jgi:hypothetical protein
MEAMQLPYEVVREMIGKIFSFAEKSRMKRTYEEKELAKKYAISILSVLKVAKVIIRKGRKR